MTELKLIEIINVTTRTQNTYIFPKHELINSGKAQMRKKTNRQEDTIGTNVRANTL